ncbi:MAG: hypothetical protein A3K19_32260 [Lentisphaerae bacterium RIFOXYB12_FULL_65_16]|nr:MAG: hypothetical protein A3K18_17805 [Lentisphaerae bacterium RIFOXYA12_64_32]OGV90135.1 MAG: hypothetical protein A3K19_32260 [Lentisphaerae bacterium RIFOXYB12_FULL_65_16]
MTSVAESQANTYELPLPSQTPDGLEGESRAVIGSLPDALLMRNVVWFCRLRWHVVILLTAFGLAGMVPGVFAFLGLRPQPLWPFVIAFLLGATNLVYLRHARSHSSSETPLGGEVILWCQIVVDLILLTVVVHYAGTRVTNVYLVYLFHIVLACIFFSRTGSLLVALVACGLFSSCVVVESLGLAPPTQVYDASVVVGQPGLGSMLFHVNVVTVQLIWLVAWYLTSQLSAMVRARDQALAATNRQLVAAQKERATHMLLTTHELKAPFAAICALSQLLSRGYCGPLSDKALDVVMRIAARSRRLGKEIQDMLQLGNLTAPSQDPPVYIPVPVVPVLEWCADYVKPLAEECGVTMHLDVTAARDTAVTTGVEEHLKMMFANLLTNAVTYSRRGGQVYVRCSLNEDAAPRVVIEDQGIGIPAAKLPRIFDEYYRTEEAVSHCRESTGLGLAIVRRVAEAHRIRIRVTSAVGAGTTFEFLLPHEK